MLTEKELNRQIERYPIMKTNDLVRQSRYSLSLMAQRLINYICMKIIPRSEESEDASHQLHYEFNIVDFCQATKLKTISGKTYHSIKASLQELAEPKFFLPLRTKPISWLSNVTVADGDGYVTVDINPALIPYLFELPKDHFTLFTYGAISDLQSAYGIRLYEFFKSYLSVRKMQCKIETLKEVLMVESIQSYKSFANFKQRVLDAAINDINTHSDIHVGYELNKRGRRFASIKFNIMDSTEYDEMMDYVELKEAEKKRSIDDIKSRIARGELPPDYPLPFDEHESEEEAPKRRRRRKVRNEAFDDDLPF